VSSEQASSIPTTSLPDARARTVASVATVAALTAASMLLRPPGLYAAVIGVALLCPWRGRVVEALEAVGLPLRTRQATGVAVMVVAAVPNMALGGQLDGHLLYGGDYHTYYIGALVGVQHGWANLFDMTLQAAAWKASPGASYEFLPYLNTPPTAWILAPLMGLPYRVGYWLFVALMIAVTLAIVGLVAAGWRTRLALLLVGAAMWDLVSSFASGQNAVLGALAVVLCWRLIEADRRVLAGVALSLIAIRPNATFLVPLALLVAGERRVFAAWLVTTLALGVASLASLGSHGLQQFIDLAVFVRRTHPSSMQLTMQQVVGQGGLAWALQLVTGLAAAVIGARRARGDVPLVLCAGLLGSLLLSPYVLGPAVVPPITMLAVLVIHRRDQGAMVILLLLLLVAPPGWALADAWPAAFIGVELVWLGWLLLRGREIHRKFPVPAQIRHRLLGEA
jgi:hypothetical protein